MTDKKKPMKMDKPIIETPKEKVDIYGQPKKGGKAF